MNVPGNLERLRFLVKIVQRESLHLRATDERLFTSPLTPERLQSIESDHAKAEQLRAERLGWITSADTWIEARRLRNQMIHEYVDDLGVLASNVQAGHRYVPILIDTAQRLMDEAGPPRLGVARVLERAANVLGPRVAGSPVRAMETAQGISFCRHRDSASQQAAAARKAERLHGPPDAFL